MTSSRFSAAGCADPVRARLPVGCTVREAGEATRVDERQLARKRVMPDGRFVAERRECAARDVLRLATRGWRRG